jgi:hypothetical protein
MRRTTKLDFGRKSSTGDAGRTTTSRVGRPQGGRTGSKAMSVNAK